MWKRTRIQVKRKDGSVVFDSEVEHPSSWSESTLRVASIQYLRVRDGVRENSFKQVFGRVSNTIAGYIGFDVEEFRSKLFNYQYNQLLAFNSPVYYNVGIVSPPQTSACFILGIEDSIESIMDTQKLEVIIYKGGSGSGVNYSKLRGSNEPLSRGGTSSGPLPFIRGADSYAKAIKSGGAHRRAAKMSILNVDHPDIFDFILCKSREEKKAFSMLKAGLDPSLDGEIYESLCFQDMNLSVRVTDAFMECVKLDKNWSLINRLGGLFREVKARDIFDAIVESIIQCGDPGVQFDDKINEYNTVKMSGRINASNPCSEFMFLDYSACNLASINIARLVNDEGIFDIDKFRDIVRTSIIAQDSLIDNSFYPDPRIRENSIRFRPLGLGITGLGEMLAKCGLAYDSDEARSMTSCIMSLLTAYAYKTSSELSDRLGSFSEFKLNERCMREVLERFYDSTRNIDSFDGIDYLKKEAVKSWSEVIESKGFRNSMVTLVAPTGTISFLLGAETTGIEPEISLVKKKTFVDGTEEIRISSIVPILMRKLSYSDDQISKAIDDIVNFGWSDIIDKHSKFFLTSLGSNGEHALDYMAHLKMMSAVQPFISGAISKTVNLPKDSGKDIVSKCIMTAHDFGLKSISIYVDKSKVAQPLESVTSTTDLPSTMNSLVHKFKIGNFSGRVFLSFLPDDKLAEVYLLVSKQGSTMNGLIEVIGKLWSYALQYGAPPEVLCEKMKNIKFEPAGFTGNRSIPFCTSIVDYVAKFIELQLKSRRTWNHEEDNDSFPDVGSICPVCGEVMVKKGTCSLCLKCGSQDGVCG